jgi:hypothetical protein
MKRIVCSTAAIVVLSMAFCCLARWRSGVVQAVAAPPLSLEGYLDEKLPEAPECAEAAKVDNSACYVCHGNYDGEPLAATHASHKVGCMDCHGESLAHRNDEDNVTPPDKMYGPEDVKTMCRECHAKHNAPASDVIARWQQRCPAKTDPQKIVCTDCHFEHRMRFRTVWWNKKTGKLVVRKEGQRTKPAGDPTETGSDRPDPAKAKP